MVSAPFFISQLGNKILQIIRPITLHLTQFFVCILSSFVCNILNLLKFLLGIEIAISLNI